MGLDEKQLQAKTSVERRKARIAQLQAQMREMAQKVSSTPRYWHERRMLQSQLTKEIALLSEDKIRLSTLCGTTGNSPKWLLTARAYRLLSRLEDQGVDIGEEGEQLLSDIEFHMPLAQLQEPQKPETGT